MRRVMLVLLGGWICFAMVGCGPALNSSKEEGPLRVAVSIVPHVWLAKKIGGEHVQVSVLAKPGEDAHTYSPTDAEVSELMRSKVYFRTGIEFEHGNWFEAIKKSKTLTMVDLREGLKLREMEAHHHHGEEEGHDDHDHKASDAKAPAKTEAKDDHDHKHDAKEPAKPAEAKHDHDHDHDHDHAHHDHAHDEHEGSDPHIWLTPAMLEIQAHTIADALSTADPANKDAYHKNLEAFEAELKEAEKTIAEKLAPLKGKAFFVFHPAWGYFAEAYGMRQIAVEVEGKEPSDHELTEVQNLARKEGTKVIFVQPQIPGRSAEALAHAIDGRMEKIDPMAEDVLENLKTVADALVKSFE